jgi:hypothetical protein
MLSKARKWASASIGAPFLGDVKRRFFLRAFLSREIFMRFSKDIQNSLLTGFSLHRGPVGEPEGDLLAGTFERKR